MLRERRTIMKRLLTLLVAVLLSISLVGCATTATTEPVKVKCPACGYEFDAPME
jgi:hypothetical protein